MPQPFLHFGNVGLVGQGLGGGDGTQGMGRKLRNPRIPPKYTVGAGSVRRTLIKLPGVLVWPEGRSRFYGRENGLLIFLLEPACLPYIRLRDIPLPGFLGSCSEPMVPRFQQEGQVGLR